MLAPCLSFTLSFRRVVEHGLRFEDWGEEREKKAGMGEGEGEKKEQDLVEAGEN